jgi:hypothetical protein
MNACLNYALSNRKEWEDKGVGLVQRYLASYKGAAIMESEEFVEVR